MNGRSVVFFLGMFSALSASAQVVIGYGAVGGTVRDYTGSGIPDTNVILTNDKTGFKRTLNTTDDGIFYAPAIPPAPGYSLKVTRKGFLDEDYKDFEIPGGHTLRFKVSLKQDSSTPSQEAQTASIELVDTTFGFETFFSEIEAESLPSRDRDPNELAPFVLNVTTQPNPGQIAAHSQASSNVYLVDGVRADKTFYFQQRPLGPAITQEDATQVQTISAGAPAEVGNSTGATVSVVTRSGGNELHGALYDYFNTGSLNAADRFAPGFKPTGSRQQFGGNAGGQTIFKKLFWFASGEELHADSHELNLASNSLLANPAGTAIQPSNCSTTVATPAQCAAAIGFLNSQLNREVTSSLLSYAGLVRLDWRLNPNNLITFEGDAMHRHAPNGTNTETVSNNADLLGANGTYSNDSRFAKAGYTTNWSGNVLNEARVGWYHDRFSDYANPALLPSTGAVGINIAGTQFGGNPNLPMANSETRWEFADNWTFSAGNHTLKLGGDFDKTEDWNRQIVNSAGNYIYPTLTAFAQDFSNNTTLHKGYTVMNQTFGQPVVDLRIKRLAAYAQDTWVPFRKLTLVGGVRWEKTFIPQPPYYNAPYYQTGVVGSPNINFTPRLGLAYQLDSRTVVRMGLAGFYQPYPGQLLDAFYTGNAIYQFPISVEPSLKGAPTFHQIIGGPKSFPLGSTDLTWAAGKLRTPISAQGTVSIERQLSRDLTVSLNYMYSRGLALWAATEQNLQPPTLTETYAVDNAAGAVVSNYATSVFNVKSNTAVAHTYQVGNSGRSTYNGASILVRKRMSRGLTAEGSYTWSRAIDDVSGLPVVAGFVPTSVTPGQFVPDQGVSAFNQPNRAVVRWVWQPKFSNDSGAAKYLINGWQISGTGTFASGLPETPLVLVNGQQFTGVTMPFTSSLNGGGGWARVPFQPVGSYLTGKMYTVDARITRDIPVNERIKGQLMFEAYNLANKQFSTSVNTLAYIATSGTLHPIAGAGLGNAAGGYPWGDNARRLQVAIRITF